MKKLLSDAHKCLRGVLAELEESGIRIIDYAESGRAPAASMKTFR